MIKINKIIIKTMILLCVTLFSLIVLSNYTMKLTNQMSKLVNGEEIICTTDTSSKIILKVPYHSIFGGTRRYSYTDTNEKIDSIVAKLENHTTNYINIGNKHLSVNDIETYSVKPTNTCTRQPIDLKENELNELKNIQNSLGGNNEENN